MDANEKSEYEKAKVLLNGYLNERLRVTISDGRVIDGRLICTDRDCNLVLSNCEEFLSKEEMSKEEMSKYSKSRKEEMSKYSKSIDIIDYVTIISMIKDNYICSLMQSSFIISSICSMN